MKGTNRLIVTSASGKYGHTLLALLGSIECNWPGHPPVRIYDIGLWPRHRRLLEARGYEVVDVPPFCPHWRRYYAWKIWSLNHAEADAVLWIDAGVCVLHPLDDAFEGIERDGYFTVHNCQELDREASDRACEGCGVERAFTRGKKSISANLVGFKKRDARIRELLAEALRVASVEDCIKPYSPAHKQDQAILSLLLYKRAGMGPLDPPDYYLNHDSPKAPASPRTWVHRRTMLPEDMRYFKRCVGVGGAPHIPKDPMKDISALRIAFRRAVYRAKVLGSPLLMRLRARLRAGR